MTAGSTWRERLRSPLTWHAAGLGVLVVLVCALGVRLLMDWSATHGSATERIAGKQVELRALERQTEPLRGLDKRVVASRTEMRGFYAKRIPQNYSSILTRIGDLEVKSGVRLSRVLYTQGTPTGDLTEISMDAGVSGEYSQIMHFVNGLERDQTFFIVRAMALTGQQGGLVNLRLRVSTWLRTADAANLGLPPTGSAPPVTGTPAEPGAGPGPGKDGE
jgi:type IV pilus assembly protein PilO